MEVDLPGVGENLQDHINCKTQVKVNRPLTINDHVKDWPSKARAGLRYAFFRDGALTVAAGIVGVFAKSRPELEVPDLQVHFFPFSGDDLSAAPHPFSALRRSSTSTSRRAAAMSGFGRAIRRNILRSERTHLEDELDQRTIFGGPPLRPQPVSFEGYEAFRHRGTEAEPNHGARRGVLAYAKANGYSCYPLCGTCRMGMETAKMSVVDDRLRVHGISGLRVADASIMPHIVSANTNVTTIMIGEKCADMVRANALH